MVGKTPIGKDRLEELIQMIREQSNAPRKQPLDRYTPKQGQKPLMARTGYR